jgi:NADH-quinone oxidoreductase subunit C
MNVELIVESLRQALSLPAIESRAVPIDDLFVMVPPERIRQAVQVLIEQFKLKHLSTITGQDTDEEIELLYHFWGGGGLTLCTRLPYQEPTVDTVIDLIPGASFYEAEVAEMLGVTFRGNPDPGPHILPDDWDGEPPLRKQASNG